MNKSKEITIVNLQNRVIYPKPGQTFKAFTVYGVSGNDGITYETTDQEFYSGLKIGEPVTIDYSVETGTGQTGKVWTRYKLLTQKKDSAALTIQGMAKIYARIEQMEKNIIAAIKFQAQEVKPIIEPAAQAEIDQVNAELAGLNSVETEEEEQNQLPF